MRAIIIGAGRGQRLMPLTENTPKCYAEIGGRRILDWGLQALRAGGFSDERIVFIGGYCIDQIQRDYGQLTFRHNVQWPHNNILASLMYAEDLMHEGFVCAYADILYRPRIVAQLMQSPHDITLVCDTAWRSRYGARSEHPETDAEKIAAAPGTLVRSVSRHLPAEAARGEYIGVARFSARAARRFIEHYHGARRAYEQAGAQGSWQSAPSFQRAYLIDLFEEMIGQGEALHLLETDGGYMEIDTTQDYRLASAGWSTEER